jgi:hypothetical protein
VKKEHASIAKITRPRVKGIFPRKRLFDLLDDSRNRLLIPKDINVTKRFDIFSYPLTLITDTDTFVF